MSENVQTFSGKVNVADNLLVGTSHFFVDRQNNRVGIGTSTPDASSMLDVTGNIKSGGTITATGGFSGDGSGLSGVNSDSGSWVNGSSSNIHLAVSTDNVGIGVVDPDGPLHLVLPATSNYTGFTYQSGDVKTVFGNTGDDSTNTSFVQVYSGVSSSVPDTNSGTYHLALQPHGGNVGIGTTSPNNSLHIYKNANERTSGLFIEKAEGGTNAAALFFGVNAPGENPGVAKAAIFYERNLVNGRGDLKFCNDASSDANNVSPETADTRMIIKNNGNVGIGTADPGSILDVHGASGASIKKTAPTASTGTYNYILNGPRPGTTSSGAVHFINGSGRSADGGTSTYTIRNDSGQLRLGSSSYTTLFNGNHLRMAENDNSFFHFGPNGTWSGELYVGATSDRTGSSALKSQVISTNGNLHLDAGNTRHIYMNHYRGNYIIHAGGGVLSDDRLKSEEELITNATDTLLKLSPQKYLKRRTLREDEDRDPFIETGLIAQDIWYDAPELRHLVHLGDDANPVDTKPVAPVDGDIQQDPDYSSWGPNEASVNYDGLIAYLIKSNQEIYEELQTTKSVLEEHTHSDLEERLKADLQTTKTELKADLQTTKEDLQSKATLEDLQTVKTQLQTTNEQNQKLEARIAFLETALISR